MSFFYLNIRIAVDILDLFFMTINHSIMALVAIPIIPKDNPIFIKAELLRIRDKTREAIALFNQIPDSIVVSILVAICHKQLGELSQSLDIYNKILIAEPNNWYVLNNIGVIFFEQANQASAKEYFNLAIQSFSIDRTIANARCIAHNNLAIVITDMGSKFKLTGDLNKATEHYLEALKYNPEYSPAYFNLGVIQSEIGNFTESLAYYNLALKHNPNFGDAMANSAVIHKNVGSIQQAMQIYMKAMSCSSTTRMIAPGIYGTNLDIIHNNMAIALTDHASYIKDRQGQRIEAISHYKVALTHNIKYAPAWYNLGVTYGEQNLVDDAIIAYEMTIMLAPKSAEAHNNLGVINKERGNLDKALGCYQAAINVSPNFYHSLNNLGVIYGMIGKLENSYECYEKALRINPNYAEAYNNLGVAFRDEGMIKEAIEYYDKCIALEPSTKNAKHNRLLAMSSISDGSLSLEQIYHEHRKWGIQFCKEYKKYNTWNNIANRDRLLRIGYLSADFITHSVAYFVEAVLKFADRSKFFVICYANVARRDKRTDELEKLSHLWRDVYGVSTQIACEMIRDDKVDILIDLTGHTAGTRLDIMAMQPAPVQVTWCGYPNTIGLPTIQYRITDETVDPPDTKQKFSEELVRLPGSFLCYTPPIAAPGVQETPAISSKFITFGSFNNLAKINDRVIATWCAILTAVPDSRLLMKCKPFSSTIIKNKYLKRFRDAGIDTSRVDLLHLVPDTGGHLAVYNLVDICVDTFPYSGTTTTFEALYMGVPVVTLRPIPNNHAQAVSSAILSHIPGCSKLIATSEQEYISIVVNLTKDIAALQELRSNIRPAMLKSVLCDGPKYMIGMENAYREMWHKFVAQSSKVDIVVV